MNMKRPQIDDKLTLLKENDVRTEGIVSEIKDNPAESDGLLINVMVREPFDQGEQVWIVDEDESKIGAEVHEVVRHTIDSEITLAAIIPPEVL